MSEDLIIYDLSFKNQADIEDRINTIVQKQEPKTEVQPEDKKGVISILIILDMI